MGGWGDEVVGWGGEVGGWGGEVGGWGGEVGGWGGEMEVEDVIPTVLLGGRSEIGV